MTVRVTKHETSVVAGVPTEVFSFSDGTRVTYKNVDHTVILAGIDASPEKADDPYFHAISQWLQEDQMWRQKWNQEDERDWDSRDQAWEDSQ